MVGPAVIPKSSDLYFIYSFYHFLLYVHIPYTQRQKDLFQSWQLTAASHRVWWFGQVHSTVWGDPGEVTCGGWDRSWEGGEAVDHLPSLPSCWGRCWGQCPGSTQWLSLLYHCSHVKPHLLFDRVCCVERKLCIDPLVSFSKQNEIIGIYGDFLLCFLYCQVLLEK